MNPPIDRAPCCKCGAPSIAMNKQGGFCARHWPEEYKLMGTKRGALTHEPQTCGSPVAMAG